MAPFGRMPIRIAAVIVLATLPRAHAGVVRQLTDLVQTATTLAGLDDTGATAFAVSSADPYGTNPGNPYQIFRWDPTTGSGAQLTALAEGVVPFAYGPSVSDDGGLVAFVSASDPVGTNPDGSPELFVIAGDGTGIVQLTHTASPDDGDIGHFALAGGGSRIVFESNADTFGTNPSRVGQLWVVEVDGTDLRQITTHAIDAFGLMWPTISDDGVRIAYASMDGVAIGGWQVFGILHDGSELRQITFEDGLYPTLPVISGDGSTIAFETTSVTLRPPTGGCWGSPGQQIAVVDWVGSDLHLVTGICLGAAYPGTAQVPDLTDDGQVVFYAANEFERWAIERVDRDGTGRAFLTDTSSEPGPTAFCWASRAAGAGSRIAFWCEGGAPWGGPNPDMSLELFAASGLGADPRQLSDGLDGDSLDPDLTPDGANIVFASDANPLGEDGYWFRQLYRMAPDGSDLARVTSFDHGEPKQPSVTDDGATIVFAHDGDPLGTNGYRAYQIFAIGADGEGLTQLTPGFDGATQPSEGPHISGDGSVVVFEATADLLREGRAGWKVYRVDPDGAGLARLSGEELEFDGPPRPRVDATGTWVVYAWDGAIHRQRTDGTSDATISGAGEASWPDVTADAAEVVYASNGDPLGTNPEGNVELFLWEAASGATRQLTVTTVGTSTMPSFQRDGQRVYFWSDAPHLGEDQEGWMTPFRVDLASGVVERVGGLASCIATPDDDPRPPAVDAAGRRAVWSGAGDCAGVNRDGSVEIVVADRDEPARIRVSPGGATTVVSWDVESGPLRYDVIRGDVAGLTLVDGASDLGEVVCLEDDSTDASTIGNEDVAQPGPGEVWFYLYRGSQGSTAGPGSYGAASSGAERVPAAGDCPG